MGNQRIKETICNVKSEKKKKPPKEDPEESPSKEAMEINATGTLKISVRIAAVNHTRA